MSALTEAERAEIRTLVIETLRENMDDQRGSVIRQIIQEIVVETLREERMLAREGLLTQVRGLEELLGISPTTTELRQKARLTRGVNSAIIASRESESGSPSSAPT